MVIIQKKIENGYLVHIQGYTFFSEKGLTLVEALGKLVLNNPNALKLTLKWDTDDELTLKHLGK